MGLCTITLQQVANTCSTMADLMPLCGVGGYVNEPFLSLANDAISDLISDENDWTFNRVEAPSLFTGPNRQDYLFAGASAFTLGSTSQGWAIGLATMPAITNSGPSNNGTVTVNTLEVHRFKVGDVVYMTGVIMTTGSTAAYNSTFTDNGSVSQWNGGWPITAVTSNSFTFNGTTGMLANDAGGAPGISNFGYATSASMQEVNNNSSPPNQWSLTVKRELAVSSRLFTPEKVAVMVDYGTGILKIRLLFVPSTVIYAVNIIFQARAPLKVSLSDTWAPFPDQFSALYRQAVLARMYRYLNSPQAQVEHAKLLDEIKKIQSADDATLTDVSLIPESSLMDSGSDWGW
jgi:hypothetical protein